MAKSNILIIGSGGREHAIGWKLSRSKKVGQVFFAPGNAGTAIVGCNLKMKIDPVNQKLVDEIKLECRNRNIEMVVIGPEDPLSQGLADRLSKEGIRVFGPSADAARLEADKAYSKALMRAASVPTAEFQTFDDEERAIHYLETHDEPIVVKAAGLAKGKGVVVCDNNEESIAAVRNIMGEKAYGEAGAQVVIEERLNGQEVSILAFVDGQNIYVLDASQDHKQVGEGDVGPNTGGMGAYCPTPVINDEIMSLVNRDVLVGIVDAMRRDGVEFKGVLYAGMMLTAAGPKTLEFNCRFGDPECQPLLVRMKADLFDVFNAVIDGKLHELQMDWDKRVACCVVLCSGGYPGSYKKGLPITGLEEAARLEDIYVFHAGTSFNENKDVVTNGGRVINVVALGDTLEQARDKANAACEVIKFEGAFYRKDIGHRVM